jgi:hypothetical protein
MLTTQDILDHFLHRAQVIAITGKSYRVKNASALSPETKPGRKPNEPPTAEPAS